jgi:hypothetical protein
MLKKSGIAIMCSEEHPGHLDFQND